MKFKQINARTIQTEANDCVVRAMTVALERSYEEMHDVCSAAGRQPRRGMPIYEIEQALTKILSLDTKMQFIPRSQRMTFAQFVKQNPTGRYVVIRRGHAVALIDGVWHDAHESGCGARARVMCYSKL